MATIFCVWPVVPAVIICMYRFKLLCFFVLEDLSPIQTRADFGVLSNSVAISQESENQNQLWTSCVVTSQCTCVYPTCWMDVHSGHMTGGCLCVRGSQNQRRVSFGQAATGLSSDLELDCISQKFLLLWNYFTECYTNVHTCFGIKQGLMK